MKQSFTITSKIKDYRVVCTDAFNFDHYISPEPTRLIVDKNVFSLYKEQILPYFKREHVFLLAPQETSKSIEYVSSIYDFLIQSQAKKNLSLFSIGGGITQDITGFVASTLYRGVRWVFWPTTLLAQTDSCIGSKTSLNYRDVKNLIGTFYPPDDIIINSSCLDTLSPQDFSSGMGEVIKLQLMAKPWTHERLLHVEKTVRACWEKTSDILPIISENLSTKLELILEDEFDKGRRNFLNYGHTLGHALETTSRYAVPHGTAVRVGMLVANELACLRGILPKKLADIVNNQIILPKLSDPINPAWLDDQAIIEKIKGDKKRTGPHLSFVLPNESGELFLASDISEKEIVLALHKLRSNKGLNS